MGVGRPRLEGVERTSDGKPKEDKEAIRKRVALHRKRTMATAFLPAVMALCVTTGLTCKSPDLLRAADIAGLQGCWHTLVGMAVPLKDKVRHMLFCHQLWTPAKMEYYMSTIAMGRSVRQALHYVDTATRKRPGIEKDERILIPFLAQRYACTDAIFKWITDYKHVLEGAVASLIATFFTSTAKPKRSVSMADLDTVIVQLMVMGCEILHCSSCSEIDRYSHWHEHLTRQAMGALCHVGKVCWRHDEASQGCISPPPSMASDETQAGHQKLRASVIVNV